MPLSHREIHELDLVLDTNICDQHFNNVEPLGDSGNPFVNLPEKHRARWGEGLTAEDMKKCVWVQPKLVVQIEFLE